MGREELCNLRARPKKVFFFDADVFHNTLLDLYDFTIESISSINALFLKTYRSNFIKAFYGNKKYIPFEDSILDLFANNIVEDAENEESDYEPIAKKKVEDIKLRLPLGDFNTLMIYATNPKMSYEKLGLYLGVSGATAFRKVDRIKNNIKTFTTWN